MRAKRISLISAVLGLAFIGFGLSQALATGNGGACYMAQVKVKSGGDGVPVQWHHHDAECFGSCQGELNCIEYHTGLSFTIGGVTYDAFDCACGLLDEFGVAIIVQRDIWDAGAGLYPKPCRTIALQSRSSNTAEYEGVACLNYGCDADEDCEIVPVQGVTGFEVRLTDPYTNQSSVHEGRLDKCDCPGT